VVYMSGFAAEPFFGQSMSSDDVDLLEKPFTATTLLTRVRLALT
jgi:FixJ family two-component response regulator